MGGERTVRERLHWEQGFESPRAGCVGAMWQQACLMVMEEGKMCAYLERAVTRTCGQEP